MRASQMAGEFAGIDTRSKILAIIDQVVADHETALRTGTMATSRGRRVAGAR